MKNQIRSLNHILGSDAGLHYLFNIVYLYVKKIAKFVFIVLIYTHIYMKIQIKNGFLQYSASNSFK